jgi:antitoxin MazE
MTTRLAKWGNSLAVRIPKTVAESARLKEGDHLALAVNKDGSLVIRPTRRKYSLDELVNRITPANRHSETDWGEPVGNEIW